MSLRETTLKRLTIGAFVLAGLLLCPGLSLAQSSLRKDAIITIKIPTSQFKRDGVLLSGGAIYSADIAPGDSGSVAVNGTKDWQASGFPSLLEGKVDKISRKPAFTEVEIRPSGKRAGFGALKLRFAPSFGDTTLPIAFDQVVVPGPNGSNEAKAYRLASYQTLMKTFFKGPLKDIPEEKQLILVEFAHLVAHGSTLGSDDFKDHTYLAVDVGSGDSVYNEIRMNQSARIAAVLNGQHLAVLKAFGGLVKDVPAVYGLKIAFKIPHKNFLHEATPAVDDVVQIYAPSDLIKKFADADITNQQFIDGCIVIADDNRVQVNLTTAP
jgi:hypothetical protein